MAMIEKGAETKVEVKPEVPTALEKSGERRLRRFDPFEMVEEMQEEMARFWSQAWPFGPRPLFRPLRRLAPTIWMPSTDVYEKDGNLVVKAELPGMKKEDIEVTLDQGDLVIRGERKAESEVTEEDYYRLERSYGSFYRRLPLGFHVTAEQIAASYHDGVLEVRIPKPKQEQPQAKKIPVA
jgi:HSP20 family protein